MQFKAFAKSSLTSTLSVAQLWWSTQARVAWTAFSAPAKTATPTCAGQKKSRAASRTASTNHLPVRRRRSSPTAMGRSPPFGFGTATRRAPVRNGATAAQASPRASKLTRAVSCASRPADDPGRQASSKSWTRRPEGPGAETAGDSVSCDLPSRREVRQCRRGSSSGVQGTQLVSSSAVSAHKPEARRAEQALRSKPSRARPAPR